MIHNKPSLIAKRWQNLRRTPRSINLQQDSYAKTPTKKLMLPTINKLQAKAISQTATSGPQSAL